MKMMRLETNLTEKLNLGKFWEGAEPGEDQAEQQHPSSEKEETGNELIGTLDGMNGLGNSHGDGGRLLKLENI